MQRSRSKPKSIWIPGKPRSVQARGPSDNYHQRIRDAAELLCTEPMRLNRVGVEIFWMAETTDRGDVDYVIKPILEALVGIAYHDDRQVRWVTSCCLPTDENYGMRGRSANFERLENEFLINVYADRIIPLNL